MTIMTIYLLAAKFLGLALLKAWPTAHLFDHGAMWRFKGAEMAALIALSQVMH
jgi:hypothetical protein